MTYVLSIMLWFVDTPKTDMQYWQHQSFETKWDCLQYLADNKVTIVDTVLETFREVEGKKLKNFEFFCESQSFVMDV